MIKGIDLGNHTTKDEKGVTFLSKVSNECGLEEKADWIILDGRKIYLGEGDFDTEYRKSYKKNLLHCLFGMLALTSNEVKNKVVLGLPLSQFKEDKLYLTNLIMQNKDKEIILNGIKKRIIIDDIEIVPEGVVAVEDTFEGIVLDIGGRTTDICLLKEEGGRRKIKKPYSMPKGVLSLEADYINCINKKLGLDLLPEDSDRILKNGLKIYGINQDISFAMEVYRNFVDALITQIQVDYPIKTYDVALVGGGADMLFNPIKTRLPNAFLVDEPYLANAIGYYEIGRSIWG